MKKYAAALLLLSGFFTACEEKGPNINLTAPTAVATDTTYTMPTETAQTRQVLVEEFTGVKCPNCPEGHAVLRSLLTSFPNGVNIVSYQAYNSAQTEPIKDETRSDNRTQAATEISTIVFGGIPSLPTAGIDRESVGGSLLNSRSLWPSITENRTKLAPPVNLTISTAYNAATRQVTATVRMAYTQAVTQPHRLSLAITEGAIVDAQEYPDSVQLDYEHEHVFRQFVTANTGDDVLKDMATKEAGRVIERQFKFVLNEAYKPENCYLLGFVHYAAGNEKSVLQSAQKKIK
jgi:hypothetical protein